MKWKFTIIDRDNVEHQIDEPTGWDSIEIVLKRDDNSHGIVFDYQNNDLRYEELAMKLLKDEYDTYGSQGNMTLVIEESCNNSFNELYRGKFIFSKYSYTSGPECFVKIPIETSGDEIDFNTKLDQKVNLESLVAFDNTTALPNYSKLPFELTLPSKGILLQDSSNKKAQTVETLGNQVEVVDPYDSGSFGTIEFALDDIAAEIGNYGFSNTTSITSNIQLYIGGSPNPDAHRIK